MDSPSLHLDVWQGDWGLPSIEQNCLAALAYCKFSSVPIKVTKSNNPWKSPTGCLPVLRYQNEDETKGAASKITDIISYLRNRSFGTDFDLTSKQSADFIAFRSLIEEKLAPALLHLWWVETKTYSELTRPAYAKLLPFPFSYYIPIRQHKAAEARLLHTRGGDNVTVEEQEAKIYKDAKECLNTLSRKLGNQNYFFGNTPSSLDALVFGQIAPLLKAPVPSTVLQNHLKGCTNLCQFCFRILATYFPQTPQEEEAEHKKAEEEKAKAAQNSEFPDRRRNMMVSGMVALTAMVGYAFISGLVQVEFTDSTNGNSGVENRPALPNFNQFDKLVDEEREEEEEQGEGESKGEGEEKE